MKTFSLSIAGLFAGGSNSAKGGPYPLLTTTFCLSCVYSSVKQKEQAAKLSTLNLNLHYV